MTKFKLNISGTEVDYEGSEKFLETKLLPLLEAFNKSHNEQIIRNLLALHEELQGNLATLEGHLASIAQLNGELARKVKEFTDKSGDFFESIETLQSDRAALFAATKEMQEMSMSFNLQYLQLQQQMSQENRAYSTVSNIMKTKHDTVKNSINNIR